MGNVRRTKHILNISNNFLLQYQLYLEKMFGNVFTTTVTYVMMGIKYEYIIRHIIKN